MAVFTPVTLEQVNAWLASRYKVGEAIEIKGINSGIENSNFFLTIRQGNLACEFVLTLFERLAAEQLPYYLNLMGHLAQKGIPVPAPMPNIDGSFLDNLNGKPATIVTKLAGSSKLEPTPAHCSQVGRMLAQMHLAGQDYSLSQPNLRSLPWWRETVPIVLPYLNSAQSELIKSELAAQENFFASDTYQQLPAGPSHCDLFRDNVLFDKVTGEDRLGGFFDFYFAGTDKWLFDLAVTVNDWCIDLNTGALKSEHYLAMMSSYMGTRELLREEKESWPMMLRAAALRFWISRLWDFHLPRDAQMLTPHDPTHFERVLLERRKHVIDIPETV